MSKSLLSINTGSPASSVDIFFVKGLAGGDPGNSREQIDSVRNAAELNHLIGLGEVRWLETAFSETKFGQNACELFSILRRGSDQDIEVAGVSGPAVKSQAVGADYDVLNAAGV